MKTLKMLAIALLVAINFTLAQTNWTLDQSHSKVGFSIVHLVISEVEGQFNNYEVSVTTNGDNFENAKINFSADVNSINTDNEKRDNHLKSADFFDSEKFPKITFVGKSLTKEDGNNYKLVGDFTIRDVTKEIELDVKLNGIVADPWGNTKAGFKISGVINRFDYGLKWNAALETGGLVVGEDVTLNINLELTKQK